MIKRILNILAISILTIGPARAENLRTLFVNMPDSIMPTLTKSERMDFLDYMDSGMRARVRNKLGGESEMTLLQDNMLSVRTSQSGRLDMVLLGKKGGGNIICIIKTVSARYDDSRLSFYTENWEPVPVKELIEQPRFDDYLTKEALKSDSLDVLKKESILRLQSITASGDTLEFRYTSLDYIGEDADRFKSWFRTDPIIYVWTGKRFKVK
ncbi:MAG: DUF3256 family protein [Bacteroidaceae bacterium]|nr:DUF3256 family protein [Bacteroidaceae bacterium]